MDGGDNLLKVVDVARRLGMSESHVRELIRVGELPALRCGKLDGKRPTYRIRVDDFHGYEQRLRSKRAF